MGSRFMALQCLPWKGPAKNTLCAASAVTSKAEADIQELVIRHQKKNPGSCRGLMHSAEPSAQELSSRRRRRRH